MADGGMSIMLMAAAAASVASSVSSIQQGQAQKQQADAAADQAKREALAQDAEASAENRKTIGSLAAVFGATNVDFGSGSAQVISRDINNRFTRARAIRMGEANRYADAVRKAGRSALISSYIQAGSSLLSTASSAAGDYVAGRRMIQGGAEFSRPGWGGYPKIANSPYNS